MWFRFAIVACAAALSCASNVACSATVAVSSASRDSGDLGGAITGIGDPSMRTLMNAWLEGLRAREPGLRQGSPWEYSSDATVFGALMFELTDMTALARRPRQAELAPYAHQFAGDMMKTPLLVRVAGSVDQPAYIAVNRRPDAALPPRVKAFIDFALSSEGQAIVVEQRRFAALSPEEAARERSKVEGFLASLDPALPVYRVAARVHGPIRSVGSDGMKSLMERWMRDFRKLQPGVIRGDRWEHLGTLNGFNALLVDGTELAPMGRELWPDEVAAYRATHRGQALVEIRVARGGFNTPQRTTAQAIFVHESNPITRISVPHLALVFGHAPTVTRWGELGLGGEWAERPITIHIPPRVAPNAMSMQLMVLHGDEWNPAAQEASIADTAAAIARDPGAIGFGGFEEGGPGLKTIAVAAQDDTPYVEGNAETASSGSYPLTRYMYIRINRAALTPQVREFLRYVLSRQGQEPILYSGYFPLTANEVREELVKLR